jgi:hypothetical protein
VSAQELLEQLFQLSLPAELRVPGADITEGQVIGFAVVIWDYLGADDQAHLEALIAGGAKDSHSYRLATAFAGMNLRNQGNQYGISVVATILNGYNGQEIPAKVGELLQLLENTLPKQKEESQIARA